MTSCAGSHPRASARRAATDDGASAWMAPAVSAVHPETVKCPNCRIRNPSEMDSLPNQEI
jgi:hypothetical protein